jgi:hypothetical protein
MTTLQIAGDVSGSVSLDIPAVAGTNTLTFPAETGTLITSASTSMPNTISWDTTVKTSGFTAAIDGGYFCNTTSAAFTVTLPATPARGDFVVIVDYAGTAGTNNILIGANGNNINGVAGNAAIRTNRQGLTLTYIDATQGWLATSNVYATSFIPPYTASYLVVAGGGGGGAFGGGGGAGGFLTGTLTLSAGTVYTAAIGGGGAGGTSPGTRGTTGSISTFPGVTTASGGGGGGGNSTPAGISGGSGGGAGFGGSTGGSGTPGQGNAGGTAPSTAGGSGGGGASAVGTSGYATFNGGNGGAGTASSITGSSVTYAGGGGGCGYSAGGGPSAGIGGPGTPGVSGGNGTVNNSNATAGIANTGGGGGGAGYVGPSSYGTGGAGGSGVVILSVPTASYSGIVTGTYTTGTSGSNTWIRWTTASGTYTA